MTLQSFFWIFLAGGVPGYALAGKAHRSALVAASAMPLVIATVFLAIILYVFATDRAPGDGFSDLAVASLTLMGALAALVAFAGGLFGVRWRRTGLKLR